MWASQKDDRMHTKLLTGNDAQFGWQCLHSACSHCHALYQHCFPLPRPSTSNYWLTFTSRYPRIDTATIQRRRGLLRHKSCSSSNPWRFYISLATMIHSDWFLQSPSLRPIWRSQVEQPLLDFMSPKAVRTENIYVQDQSIAGRALGGSRTSEMNCPRAANSTVCLQFQNHVGLRRLFALQPTGRWHCALGPTWRHGVAQQAAHWMQKFKLKTCTCKVIPAQWRYSSVYSLTSAPHQGKDAT
jgi:hypothetical protein